MRTRSTALLVLVACGGAGAAESSPPAAQPAPAARPGPAPSPGSPAREARLFKLGDPEDGSAGLSAEQILAVVKARKPEINDCYQVELQQHTTLSGKVVVSWEIADDGRTENVALASTTLQNPKAESCVLRHVSQLVFPPPVGGKRVKVNFPFVFQPRGE